MWCISNSGRSPEISSSRQYGCVVTHPPTAARIGPREATALHRALPDFFRRLPTWSHFVLSDYENFEPLIKQEADAGGSSITARRR